MKLLVEELSTSLDQNITIGDENILCQAIRPHLYKHNAPSGNLKIQVLNSSTGNVIAESNAVTITSIDAADFFHGEVRFDINFGFRKNTSYKIRLLAGGGYSFGESAYVGWCKDFDLRKVEPNFAQSNGVNSPLLLEIWAQTGTIRGQDL